MNKRENLDTEVGGPLGTVYQDTKGHPHYANGWKVAVDGEKHVLCTKCCDKVKLARETVSEGWS